MRFRYLILADAANSIGGKVNILGAGVRRVSPPTLPAIVPLAIIGSVEGGPKDAGNYPLEVTITGPEGTGPAILQQEIPFPKAATDGLPATVNFLISLPFQFSKPGRRRIRARLGRLQANWVFIVEESRGPESGQGIGD